MVSSLLDPVRERIAASSGAGDISLFGATPGTFGTADAVEANYAPIASQQSASSDGGQAAAPSAPASATHLGIEPGGAFNSAVQLSAPTAGTLAAATSVAAAPQPQASQFDDQPGSVVDHQGGHGLLAANRSDLDLRTDPVLVQHASDPAAGAIAPTEAVAAPAIDPASAASTADAAQIQALADSIRTQLDTLTKLLPALPTADAPAGNIDVVDALQASVDQIATLAPVQLVGDLVGTALPAVTAPVLAVTPIVETTVDGLLTTTDDVLTGTQDLVQSTTGAVETLLPATSGVTNLLDGAVGATTSTVQSLLPVASGVTGLVDDTVQSLLGEDDGLIGGTDISGGIATLTNLLHAGDGFAVEDADTGETVFSSLGATLDGIGDLADLGGVLDQSPLTGSDDGTSDGLLNLVTHTTTGLGDSLGLFDEDHGLNG